MKPISEMTQAELAAFVQSKLSEQKIDVVLSGGAAVAFYTGNKYTTHDIDLVETLFSKRDVIRKVLIELGFEIAGRHYTHPDTRFFVEFPAGPLSAGSEPVNEVRSIQLDTGTLKIISQTDAVKDRLLAYFYWNDNQSLGQAILLSENCKIDFGELNRWAENEQLLDRYLEIADQLRQT